MNPFWLNLSFFLLLLFLPNQLGLHLWPSWTVVQGLRIDYLSPTLYLSYLLAAVFISSAAISSAIPRRRLPNLIFFLLFTLIFILSALLSTNPPASLLKLDQLLFFALLGITFIKVANRLTWGWLGLPLALTWSAALAIFQFFTQRSLGLWILGERTFSLSTPGIAVGSFFGRIFLRPYSTFSHPNSLAGFLLVGAFLIFALKKNYPSWLFALTLSLSLFALILSGSRAALFTTLFLLCLIFVRRFLSFRSTLKILGIAFLFTVYCLLFTNVLPSDQSLSRRLEQIRFSVIATSQHPLIGVGLNNFIPVLGLVLPSANYPDLSSPVLWLQPAHNVFLLILVETGLVGFTLFLVFLLLSFRFFLDLDFDLDFTYYLFLSLLAILFTSFFDHYWFTLIQNQLLATIVFALVWLKSSKI